MRARLLAVCSFVLVGLAVVTAPSWGQAASPPAKTDCKFSDGKTIHVDYSSPRMRGRKIFGDLVPYGEPWRVGANDATTFVIDTNVNVAGKDVPAGSYTLFALPNPDSWQLIINKTTGEWGIPYPGAESDYARVPMKLSKLSSPLEDFTIGFDSDGKTCAMHLDWDTTRATVDITEKK